MCYDDWGMSVCWRCGSVIKGVQTVLVVMGVMEVRVIIVVVIQRVIIITGRLISSGSCRGAGTRRRTAARGCVMAGGRVCHHRRGTAPEIGIHSRADTAALVLVQVLKVMVVVMVWALLVIKRRCCRRLVMVERILAM